MNETPETLLKKAETLEKLRLAIIPIGDIDCRLMNDQLKEDIKKAMTEIAVTAKEIAKAIRPSDTVHLDQLDQKA